MRSHAGRAGGETSPNSASSLLLPAEKEGDRPMSGMNHFQVRLTRSL